jgi:hypothetical protein
MEWSQEAADDCAERHDWRALHKTQTIAGDGVASSFALNSDFARLAKMPAVTRSGASAGFWPTGPVTPPTWIGVTNLVTGIVTPIYQIENGTIYFSTTPAVGDNFIVSYQASKPLYTVTGTPGPVPRWTADSDTVLFSERLVMLGTVARWKWSKGFDAAKFEDDYERALERLASADWGLMAIDTANSYREDADEFGDVVVTP